MTKRYCTEKPVDNLKVICVYSLSCVLCSRAVGKLDVAKSRTKDGLLLIEWYHGGCMGKEGRNLLGVINAIF